MAVTVNGCTPPATSYGASSTASSLASALAGSINSASCSSVTATASGGALTITSKTNGANTNYSFSTSSQGSSQYFTGTSFPVSPASGSLSGGQNFDTNVTLQTPYSTFYSYDVLNDLTQVTQGAQTRAYSYDGLGRTLTAKTPESGAVSYSYTNFGAVNQRTDARNIVTTYSYDGLNRLSEIQYSGNANGDSFPINYAYDSSEGTGCNNNGRLATVYVLVGAFPNYQQSFCYDQYGRPTTVSTAASVSSTVGYTYDLAGQIAALTYPSGDKVTDGYDSIGRLNSVSGLVGGANTNYFSVPAGGYNAAGQPTQLTYGNGVQGLMGYNDHMQVNSIEYKTSAGADLLNLSAYNYAAPNGGNDGEIYGITDTRGSGYSTTYTYDQWARLSSAQDNDLTCTIQTCGVNSWKFNWSYDRYGNRLSQQLVGGTGGFTQPQIGVDATTNRVNTAGFSYDASGNMTSDGTTGRVWSYTEENRLSAQTDGANITASYAYSPGGLRYAKDVPVNGNNVETEYVYSGVRPIAEYTNGALSKEYIYAGSQMVASVDASGNPTYYHLDHLSIRVETNASAATVRTFGHLPFGDVWYECGATCPSAPLISDKWKFTTYERDAESEPFDYAVFRSYSSLLGRFIQSDPAGLAAVNAGNPQSWNLYAYSLNAPTSFFDPLGLACSLVFVGPCPPNRQPGAGDGSNGTPITDWNQTGNTGPHIPPPFPDPNGTLCIKGVVPGHPICPAPPPKRPPAQTNCVPPNPIQRIGIPIQAAAAKWWNMTIGLGMGGSVGAGGGIGVQYSFSRQLVVTPSGDAAFETTIDMPTSEIPYNAVGSAGAAVTGGFQASVSNATSPQDLTGPSLDTSAGGGDGAAIAIDSSIGPDGTAQSTVTLGGGAGGKGTAASTTSTTTVTPICGNFGG